MIQVYLHQLLDYALKQNLLEMVDAEYAINRLLRLFDLDSFECAQYEEELDFHVLLERLLDYATSKGLIDQEGFMRDHFEAQMMDCFLPRPSELNRLFREQYKKGPLTATTYFYRLSQATNYIKTERIKNNIAFVYNGKYTPLQITINLSKPEKDPKLIAQLAKTTSNHYPKCALCMENVGFHGTLEKAPRSNHRVIDLTLNHEKNAWGFQYSPYAYFNEHCIILKKDHIPMKVDDTTLDELVDFVNQFPHYLIGSNAGLPIVGGSILDHYHFQGGRHRFPIFDASVKRLWKKRGVEYAILDWPMSVIRVSSHSENKLLDSAKDVFHAWQQYNHPEIGIHARTTEPHNTITPILYLEGSMYHMLLVLRNNYASEERPYGHFHPREAYFNIKKENIGLIEVMGLAILPGRLKRELELIQEVLIGKSSIEDYPELNKHQEWVASFQDIPQETDQILGYLKNQVGAVFEHVLEDCAVFPKQHQEAFYRFLEHAIG